MLLAAMALVGATMMQTEGDADDKRPAAFQEQVGPWLVMGDPKAGACLMLLASEGNTSLGVAAVPSRSDLVFSISNDAWKSLGDEKSSKLNAEFYSSGEITDLWNLSVTSYNNEERGPVINWTIDRAANDGASFVQQFSTASEIRLLRDKVPVAKFNLGGSAKAVGRLMACREVLRNHPDFDPFAG